MNAAPALFLLLVAFPVWVLFSLHLSWELKLVGLPTYMIRMLAYSHAVAVILALLILAVAF